MSAVDKRDLHAINQTLLTLLDNQISRTRFAFEGLDEDLFNRDPGNGCKSIRLIGEHLLELRGFQLFLMQSELMQKMPTKEVGVLQELIIKLDDATGLVKQAIEAHDPADWYAEPTEPREGPWADLPTMQRLVRPMNDFTNHLGAIRAIRQIFGNPAELTQ